MSDRQRNYEIQILTPDRELITIKPPFSVHFKIVRNTLASANTIKLTLFNLSPKTRNRIFKDRYSISEYWQLVVRAGYERLETVFQGNIYESISYKGQGSTEYLTVIDGFDGLNGIQNGFTNTTVNSGTPQTSVINGIIKDMPNMLAGILGKPSEGTNERGKVLMGKSADVLADEVEGQYFIDNETLNVVEDEEYLPGQVILLDQNKIFSTPKRRDTFLDVEVLFLPEAKIGLLCEVRSSNAIYNGQYKTMGFTHDVTISNAESGTAKTMLSLYAGSAGLRQATSG
jgi:hypothetical protein